MWIGGPCATGSTSHSESAYDAVSSMGTKVTLAPMSWTVSPISVLAKIGELDGGPEDAAGRARLDEMSRDLPSHVERAAGHLDRDLVVHESRPHAGPGHRPRAPAPGPRGAGPALPQLHASAPAVQPPDECDLA